MSLHITARAGKERNCVIAPQTESISLVSLLKSRLGLYHSFSQLLEY